MCTLFWFKLCCYEYEVLLLNHSTNLDCIIYEKNSELYGYVVHSSIHEHRHSSVILMPVLWSYRVLDLILQQYCLSSCSYIHQRSVYKSFCLYAFVRFPWFVCINTVEKELLESNTLLYRIPSTECTDFCCLRLLYDV